MDDHDRPLSARGQMEAENAGLFLKQQGIAAPDLVYCSSALRTMQTLDYALNTLEAEDMPQTVDRRFYLAARETLLEEIQNADDEFSRLMIVGHNPGMGELAQELAGGRDGVPAFPPAALAIFTCDVGNWADVTAAETELATFYSP
jgi:phosphohistidine phosphatase